MNIGVLALQGAFSKHAHILNSLEVHPIEVRKPCNLLQCDALIIPGGESTAIAKQMTAVDLWDPIRQFSKISPIFGTCAGLIFMASKIIGSHEYAPLGLLSVVVKRNAYGRQTESFQSDIPLQIPHTEKRPFQSIFIRAPIVEKWGSAVQVFSEFNRKPILIQEGIHLGATFHPELTEKTDIHKYFLSIVKKCKGARPELSTNE